MALDGSRTFVGFGFGPIQSGLFAYEAWRSGAFGRIAVAEVDRDVIEALRRNEGRYALNVATRDGVECHSVGPVEVLDPRQEADRERLEEAVSEASEIATALPNTSVYRTNGPEDLSGILGRGLAGRTAGRTAVVYCAENRHGAARVLESAVRESLPAEERVGLDTRAVFVDTVIGKMSGVLVSPEEIEERALLPLAPGIWRAHLVESFRRILIERPRPPVNATTDRGLRFFEEKDDLTPFEDAKLYGHNAAHAVAAYLGEPARLRRIAELPRVPGAVEFVRAAFLEECGGALIHRHHDRDPLFTEEGWAAYVDDLVERMLNPHLGDLVFRVGRDPARKLGWNDRLIGTLRIALEAGIRPWRLAVSAASALGLLHGYEELRDRPDELVHEKLPALWAGDEPDPEVSRRVLELVRSGRDTVIRLLDSGSLV